jgi:hypothetical protein
MGNLCLKLIEMTKDVVDGMDNKKNPGLGRLKDCLAKKKKDINNKIRAANKKKRELLENV